MPLSAAFFQPHEEAAALIRGKPAVTKEVFDRLLPELRARAMTVTGLEGLGAVERIRDEIATYARGQTAAGEAVTWKNAKAEIVKVLDAAQFSPVAAERRATLLLRTHGFQAFQAANWRVGMEDDDTTHWQYLATEDSHVRDSHLALNGLVLPKHDPFWDKHFPPWEWGCRCRVRPMNPDLVGEERALDAGRKPEDRLVLEGPALERLRAGQIVRGELKDRDGRSVGMGAHDVTPPADKAGDGRKAFAWHPGELKLSLADLKSRHDPAVWGDFEQWAKATPIEPGKSVFDWISGSTPGGGTPKVSTLHEVKRTESGAARAGALADAGGTLESAAADARGSSRAAPTHDEPRHARLERIDREQRRLAEWAARQGKLGGNLPASEAAGGEHQVSFAPATGRYLKVNRPDRHQGYGIGLGSHLQGASPAEYLDRLQLQNELFHDDIRLERVVPRGSGGLAIVTSQPRISGEPAAAQEIDALMQAKGFAKLAEGAYLARDRGLLVFDMFPRNVVRAADDTLYPIDPVIQRVDADFAEFLTRNPERIHDRP
jgi:SPP1 gp7 family putative phage head morphogenesis protein